VPTRANNQPAFGYYLRDPVAPILHAHGLVVLTLAGGQREGGQREGGQREGGQREGGRISAITRFGDNSLFPHFGLPRTLRE
jgi:RNA polymerase sigma-70 factor (ECF subfamily)